MSFLSVWYYLKNDMGFIMDFIFLTEAQKKKKLKQSMQQQQIDIKINLFIFSHLISNKSN